MQTLTSQIKQHLCNAANYLLHAYYCMRAQHCGFFLVLDHRHQSLFLLQHGTVFARLPVSTAQAGSGETTDSGKTPRGWLRICAGFGQDCHASTMFVSRKPVGHYPAATMHTDPILARILWLEGVQLHNRNTKERMIYLHGCADHASLGLYAKSHGCIRLHPQDMIYLFNFWQVAQAQQQPILLYSHDANNLLPWQSPLEDCFNSLKSLLPIHSCNQI